MKSLTNNRLIKSATLFNILIILIFLCLLLSGWGWLTRTKRGGRSRGTQGPSWTARWDWTVRNCWREGKGDKRKQHNMIKYLELNWKYPSSRNKIPPKGVTFTRSSDSFPLLTVQLTFYLYSLWLVWELSHISPTWDELFQTCI